MSTNMPGFHQFSVFLRNFVMAKLATSSIRVKFNRQRHAVLNRCVLGVPLKMAQTVRL